MNWQPIETSPLDGTGILLWSRELDEPTIGRWSIGHEHLRQWWVDAWAPPEFKSPTHWMPLPAPPDAAQPVQPADDALDAARGVMPAFNRLNCTTGGMEADAKGEYVDFCEVQAAWTQPVQPAMSAPYEHAFSAKQMQEYADAAVAAERERLAQPVQPADEASPTGGMKMTTQIESTLKQQAQIWKQEAQIQKATVQECYQACTGATGEPGDWHGAEPIRAALRAKDDEIKALREALAKAAQPVQPAPKEIK